MSAGSAAAERSKKVQELFEAALGQEPELRSAFLAEACANDSALLSEVESLLQWNEEAPGFHAVPALARSTGETLILQRKEQTCGQVNLPIGAYALRSEIGRGGMGTVWLAERVDGEFRKTVAIKLINRGMDTDEIVSRFRNEREILAALEHPSIARMLDGGTTADGLPYFVMEYIEGEAITEHCANRQLPLEERLRLFCLVCLAVQYAHQNLVVHRDLKPSNILVTPQGAVKLLDFGIAKLLHPQIAEQVGEQTATVVRPFTPAYASPEQIRGERVTTASDIYSLGVVLYELLTGARPYRLKANSREELAKAICEVEPEKPSSRLGPQGRAADRDYARPTKDRQAVSGSLNARTQRRVRGELDSIVLMALRKEPQRRYTSVEQMAEDIDRYLQSLPVRAQKQTLSYRTAKFVTRHKAALAGAFLFSAALFSGLVATLWQARVARRERAIAVEKAIESKSRLATIHAEQGRQLLLSGDPLRGILYLDKAQQDGASGPALQYLFGRATRALDAQLLTLPHANYVRDAQFSPDGSRAVTASWDKTGKLWDASTGKLIASLEGHRDRVMTARFNADGSRVVTASIDGTAAIWDGRTGKLIASLEVGPPIPPLPDAMASADFSSDGKLVAAAVGKTARIWDASSLAFMATLEGHSDWIEGLAFKPQGHDVFTWARDGMVKGWQSSGRLVYSIAANTSGGYQARVISLTFSADGKRFATAGWDHTTRVWDAETGSSISTTRDQQATPHCVGLSPDGATLVSTSQDNIAKVWDAATGELLRFLKGHTGAVRFATYSADGQRLLTASSDATAKLWSAHGGASLMTFVGHADSVVAASFAADSNRIITASYDGTAKIWDSSAGPLLATIDEPDYVNHASFSADGRQVLLLMEEGAVRVWDLVGPRLLQTIKLEKGHYMFAAGTADRNRLAVSRGGGAPGAVTEAKKESGDVRILDIPSGRIVARLQAHSKPVTSLAFSADGKRLVTAGDQTARVWDASNGALLTSVEGHDGDISAVAISPDGNLLLTGGNDQRVVMWSVANGSRRFTLDDFKGSIRWIAFSADGSRFATASRDKRLIVWDSASGRRILIVHEANANVNTVEFNSVGTLLLTADVPGSASVWDAGSGQLLSRFVQGSSPVDRAQFSADGKRIVTGILKRALIWDTHSDTRSPAEMSAYIRCRVPFRVDSEQLVPASLDTSCAR